MPVPLVTTIPPSSLDGARFTLGLWADGDQTAGFEASGFFLEKRPVTFAAASTTTGIPLLAPDPKAVDAIGIVAVCIELLGLGCAAWLAQPVRRHLRRPLIQEVTR